MSGRSLQLCILVLVMISSAGWSIAAAQDPLETETCRLLKQGAGKIVDAVEYQTSSDGKELAIPVALEFGIFDSLEIEFEPVAYTSIHPKGGSNVNGFGDTEATLKYLVVAESDLYPALAVAAEFKVPTAKSTLIGTGEPDYTLTLIASKKLGEFDLHVNLGYTLGGSPPGGGVSNTFNYAVAAVFRLEERLHLCAEVIGTVSAGGGNADNPLAPEAGGGETQLFVGARWFYTPSARLFFGVGYDNNSAVQFRLGLSLTF